MSSHPDADAFIRNYLRNPTETTTRLVFADWLEETNKPSNIAWAQYIRLKVEEARFSTRTLENRKCELLIAELVPQIKARLTIPAGLFVCHHRSLLQLLPAQNYSVRLTSFEIPRSTLEWVPESVSRENRLVPFDHYQAELLVAMTYPSCRDTIQKLQFILNRDIVAVHADEAEIQEVLNWYYGEREVENVDDSFIEFADIAGPRLQPPTIINLLNAFDAPVVRLVNLILIDAIDLHADAIQIAPTSGAIEIRYRVRDEWIERESLPDRFGLAITARLAIMAGIDASTVFNKSLASPVFGEIKLSIRGDFHSIGIVMRPNTLGLLIDVNIRAQPTIIN